MNWTRCTAAIGGKRKWREGKGSPYTGKLSARPAGKPGYFDRQGEFATIPSPPPLLTASKNNTEGPQYAF